MKPSFSQLCAQARLLGLTPCVTLELTPGWCLASVEIYRGRRRIHFGRGGRTQRAAVARLVKDLKVSADRTGRAVRDRRPPTLGSVERGGYAQQPARATAGNVAKPHDDPRRPVRRRPDRLAESKFGGERP